LYDRGSVNHSARYLRALVIGFLSLGLLRSLFGQAETKDGRDVTRGLVPSEQVSKPFVVAVARNPTSLCLFNVLVIVH